MNADTLIELALALWLLLGILWPLVAEMIIGPGDRL
jgi:hypothetical protein